MRAAGFDFSLSRGSDGVDVRLAGDLDSAAVFRLEPALDQLGADAADGRVTFDMRELTFIGSAGLGLLVSVNERLRGRRVETRFLPAPPQVMRVFAVTGLDVALPFAAA